MLVVKLQGGLGNQMFQYAFGKILALKLIKPLYFDFSFYDESKETDEHTIRSYELDLFEISLKFAPRNKIKMFVNPSFLQLCLNKLGLFKKYYFKEGSFLFNPKVYQVSTGAYLNGYWQSEKYFKPYSEAIRQDFIFKKPLNIETSNLSKEINRNDFSVSIHVRRGDFISSSVNNQVHGTCSIEYYKKAITMMKEKLKDPFFYFFSDDIDWVKNNLIDGLQNYYLITHNRGEDSWQDMALMTQCGHNIIANSSFSWWGAWLNPNPLKLVIAPKNWFSDQVLNEQTKTLIPEDWIRL